MDLALLLSQEEPNIASAQSIAASKDSTAWLQALSGPELAAVKLTFEDSYLPYFFLFPSRKDAGSEPTESALLEEATKTID